MCYTFCLPGTTITLKLLFLLIVGYANLLVPGGAILLAMGAAAPRSLAFEVLDDAPGILLLEGTKLVPGAGNLLIFVSIKFFKI